MSDSLLGRLALVTGAGRGNGAAIARGLAEAGAEVIVTDIDKDAAHTIAESIAKQGGKARGFALELAPDGVRVNALAPGIIATAMSELTRADPKRLEAFLARVPMKRVGEP